MRDDVPRAVCIDLEVQPTYEWRRHMGVQAASSCGRRMRRRMGRLVRHKSAAVARMSSHAVPRRQLSRRSGQRSAEWVSDIQRSRILAAAVDVVNAGPRVVTASDDRTARLWDNAGGASIAVLRGHDGGVLNAAFSPDGRRVVTASWDSTARLWDAATGEQVGGPFVGHSDTVSGAAFSDGAGDPGRPASIPAAWSSSTRPGSRPAWPRCADGE